MFRRRIFVVLVVSALLLPAVLECLAAGTADAQNMRCCAAGMSCPRHQKQTCVSTTAPADNLQSVPPARASLAAPSLATDAHPQAKDLTAPFVHSSRVEDVAEYSPPELYTLHSALLI
jgi:hypothetical protein